MASNFARVRGALLIAPEAASVRASARRLLEAQGFQVEEAENPSDPLVRAQALSPDVIVLQWSDKPSLRRVLAQLASNGSRPSSVIILANTSEIQEALGAIELGIDDCVRTPLDDNEFVARINACVRRRFDIEDNERLKAGPIFLDKAAHNLLIDNEPINLAPTEFRLMQFFLENPGRVFSRDELLRGAWTRNMNAGPRTVDVHVRRLRQRLEPFDCDRMIQTVRSFGYRFATENAGFRDRSPEEPSSSPGKANGTNGRMA